MPRMLSSLLSARPRRTLLTAALFVALAGAIGGPLAGSLNGSSDEFLPRHSDSQQAVARLQSATGASVGPGLVLVVDTPQGVAAGKPRIAAVVERLGQVPGVLRAEGPAAVADGGHRVLVEATLRAGADDQSAATAAQSAFAGWRGVVVGGPAVAGQQISSTVTKDLGRAELLAIPLLVVLALLFFGGRAALMPVAVGVTTVLGTFLVLTGVNHVYGLSVFALNLVIGVGLGLSVDYTLFLLTRFRREQAAGASTPQAIATTMSHAGRSVLFSAATVAGALATLIVFPLGFAKSMGIAGAAVALVAAAAALAITPALLALWGPKLARSGSRLPPRADGSGGWYRFAHAVMRRPGAVAVLCSAAMVAAALPALGTVWTPVDSAVIPRGDSARTVADLVARDFHGAGQAPVTVAIEAPRADGTSVRAYAARVTALPGVARLDDLRAVSGDTWQLDMAAAGDPAGAAAQRLVRDVRALPAPFAVHVAGPAAQFVDQQDAIADHLPEALALLVGLTFVLLWLMTGSVVLPLKAVVMNALTVGVALSCITVIYGHGRLTGLLGYTPNGGVEPTDFLVAAAVVFGLSTDYGVFLLSSIREARAESASEREAVAAGLGRSGRVVTAAAILLAVAIGAFATSRISFIQQIGLASAAGVLIDAFVVRSLLVPSLMALLGRWNWWSPPGLARLHGRLALAPSHY